VGVVGLDEGVDGHDAGGGTDDESQEMDPDVLHLQAKPGVKLRTGGITGDPLPVQKCAIPIIENLAWRS